MNTNENVPLKQVNNIDSVKFDEVCAMTKPMKIVVIFEVIPSEAGKAEYFKLGAALKEELRKMPGFINVERFASVNNEGKCLSLSFWKSEEAATGWRN